MIRRRHHHEEPPLLLEVLVTLGEALGPFCLGFLVGFGLWGSGLFNLHS